MQSFFMDHLIVSIETVKCESPAYAKASAGR